VTRPSLREYAAVQRERYLAATRAEKGTLLDEVVTVTGLHRKAAIRLLRRPPRAPTARSRAGRPAVYGSAVAQALEVLWQATGGIGPQRLHPFVPELLERLVRDGELRLAPEVDQLVRQVSPATHVGTWLRHEIPIRTFTEWDNAGPGFLEVDLVAHCGSSTKDFYLCTPSGLTGPATTRRKSSELNVAAPSHVRRAGST
jgi:hypothetical protein